MTITATVTGATGPLLQTVQAALAYWGNLIPTDASIEVLVDTALSAPNTLATARSATSVVVGQKVVTQADTISGNRLSVATYDLTQTGAGYEWRTGVDPNGAATPDILVSVNPSAALWYDPTPGPLNPAAPPTIPEAQYDAFTVIVGALGDALGVEGLRDASSGAVTGAAISLFDRNVVFLNDVPYFTGANATAVYGGPVPLTAGSLYSYSFGGEPLDGVLATSLSPGRRVDVNALDRAILRDSYLAISTTNQTLTGTTQNDTLSGAGGHDVLSGGDGSDSLLGGGGDDLLTGGDGNDTLAGDPIGFSNADILLGQNGDDWLTGGGGNDWLSGGAGRDVLYGETGQDTLDGGPDDDLLYGDYYGDRNTTTNSTITPVATPTLNNDRLSGGTGNDTLHGGAGSDTLTGGLGSDYFRYTDVADSTLTSRDVVTDFRGDLKESFNSNGSHAAILFYSAYGTAVDLLTTTDLIDFRGVNAHTQRDMIDLSEIDADTLTSGKQGFSFIDQAAFSAAGQVRWRASGTSIFVEATVSSALSTDLSIELQGLAGNYTLTSRDFVLGTDPQALRAGLAEPETVPLIEPLSPPGSAALRQTGGVKTPNGVIADLSAGTAWSSLGGAIALPTVANLVGGNLDDRLSGNQKANALWGDDGDDTLEGLAGNDTLTGGFGNERMAGGDDADVLFGAAGSDLAFGNAGADLLFGNMGDDALYGGRDDDTLYGGRGNDALSGDDGGDVMLGDPGDDTVWGGGDSDALSGGDGADLLFGNAGADRLFGNMGADSLYGGLGDDTLYGGLDADALFGDDGADRLSGDAGADTLTGGAGADLFLFAVGGGNDRITDFNGAAGDRIGLATGQGWTVTANGAGEAVIVLSGADSLTLAGVSQDQFQSGWLSFA